MSRRQGPSTDSTATLVANPSSLGKQKHTHTTYSQRTEDIPVQYPPPRTEIVPPSHAARTLVLCFDGTGDQFDDDNSNVAHFFSALKKDDPMVQAVYYQSGIGTYTAQHFWTPIVSKLSKIFDQAWAWNIGAHVMDGYTFLMQNYSVGDRICIFGFSRGAHTARALAGMLHKVGLLPRNNMQQVAFAYDMYSSVDKKSWTLAGHFKKCFCITVDIEFIGVWDTVESVGLFRSERLPFATSNTIVHTFRHALALDEHRVKFRPNRWNRTDGEEAALGTDGLASEAAAELINARAEVARTENPSKDQLSRLRELEHKYTTGHKVSDIKEVWFAGCHCDVGGGSVENQTPHNLARIPLRWMIRECFRAKSGILFEADKLRDFGLNPSSLWPAVPEKRPKRSSAEDMLIRAKPKTPEEAAAQAKREREGEHLVDDKLMEEHEELKDALSPIYDQLEVWWVWRLMEQLWLTQYRQLPNNEWKPFRARNRGAPREIEEARPIVHRSVLIRMEAAGHEDPKIKGRYKPRALPVLHSDYEVLDD